MAAAVLGAVAVAALVGFVTKPVPITVDGHRRMVAPGTTVSGLLASHALVVRHGNIVAVVTRRVLRPGGGADGMVLVNSEPATGSTTVQENSVVVSVVGSDLVEPTRSVRVIVAPRSHYLGHGAWVAMTDPGREGVSIVTRGALSGEVVDSNVIVAPRAATIRRYGYTGHAKVIALSFDDGPHPTWTPKVLAVLAGFKIKATFFEIGTQVLRYPAVAREVAKAGMLIGNHTQTHQDLGKLRASRVAWQIDTDEATIQDAAGVRPLWLRPPDGALSRIVYEQANKAHVRIMLWDVDTNDWQRPPTATIVARVLAGARPGAVILMHDGGGDRSNTVAALPTIIKRLLAEGYRFETVGQMLGG